MDLVIDPARQSREAAAQCPRSLRPFPDTRWIPRNLNRGQPFRPVVVDHPAEVLEFFWPAVVAQKVCSRASSGQDHRAAAIGAVGWTQSAQRCADIKDSGAGDHHLRKLPAFDAFGRFRPRCRDGAEWQNSWRGWVAHGTPYPRSLDRFRFVFVCSPSIACRNDGDDMTGPQPPLVTLPV